ncbi:MAG TPA: peptide-N-glycosidase F-related protein [Bacteroidia bacterium]|nr:peptide-N-glycosidase F-related protein [Bacteroidia bacterium]
MNRLIKLFAILLLFKHLNAHAQAGDTITVQTFTFGSPQDAWFVFPSDTVGVEKILMKYTLKCNPAQSPACGEWDYLTYTYLYDHTGLTDSAMQTQNNFTVNGQALTNFAYTNQQAYNYTTNWQYAINNTDTTSFSMASIGNQNLQNQTAIQSANAVSRSQHLWTAAELTAAGLTPGAITGMQLQVLTAGNLLRHFTLKFGATLDNVLNTNNVQNSGLTTVYNANTQLINGSNSIAFISPYIWDGTSNILIDMTFDNLNNGSNQILASSNTGSIQSIYSSFNDRYMEPNSNGFVNVPLNNSLAAIDTFITVSFWAYGNPNQPSNGSCFEATDAQGNRVLNTHTPWSDSNVYWDAGFSGTSYDRINKVATTSEFEGNWNHWAFIKNAATGSMKIYLNGSLWHTGTGKTKLMNNINQFKIGRGVSSSSSTYDGKMDDFAVFNKELDQNEIQSIMYTHIDNSHPLYNNLSVYYHFNEGNGTAIDFAPGNNNPAFFQNTNNPLKNASELASNFAGDSLRPNIVFEQGVFTSTMDSTLIVDSTLVNPVQILTYANNGTPTIATDTIWAWPMHYYNYIFDANGNAIDSTLSSLTDSLVNGTFNYYTYFPQVIRYELARYITPYGNGLSLGNGWTWTFDVSDYRTLLADSVHLSAGNWQELLDMRFEIIKGTPSRDIISIQNIYSGGYDYGNAGDPIDNHLLPVTVNIPANAVTARWKSRITGHGMDTPENCAEFCPKYHYFKVNGTQQFSKLVWRDNCDVNPLYPQGGTWVYDRSNWCPGAEVWTYDFELTPFVTPGNAAILDHDVQPYSATSGWHYYQIEDQIVTYGAPNFTNDASLETILSPSNDQMYQRFNTICTHPIIKIKNNGSNNLTSLTITYGMNGATPSVYNWTGNLKFEETAQVTLGDLNWAQGASYFTVTLSNPNGVSDEYAPNNSRISKYNYPSVMPASFIVTVKTNVNPWETEYSLKDAAGNIIFERNSLNANTIYRDTVNLAQGCYEFRLTDSGEDGLSFWANTAQGSGYARYNSLTGAIIKSFGADFGGEIYQQFTVGLTNATQDYIFEKAQVLKAFPNPNNGLLYVTFDLPQRANGILKIVDLFGKVVFEQQITNKIAENYEVDMTKFSAGVYQVVLNTDAGVSSQKVILEK